MRKLLWISAAIVVSILSSSFLTPAFAQATRTWVSGVGDDANPCSRTAPCKTFAGAISKTAPFGAIDVLDPGGFGAVTITKSITIRADHVEGGVLVSGTNGIVVNVAATDRVILEGLDIDGIGTGLNGVNVIGGGKVTVSKCVIRGFTQSGIRLAGTVNARLYAEDTLITNNNLSGALVQGAAGVTNGLILNRVTIDSNGPAGVKMGPASTLTISGSAISGSTLAVDLSAGGAITSYGNSVMRPAPTIASPLPLQ